MAAREVLHCSDLVCELLDKVKTAVGERENRNIEEINEDGNNIRKLYSRIMEYLANMFSAGVLTEEQASQTAGLMYILSDVDRMGSSCANIADAALSGVNFGYFIQEENEEDEE
ncbi:MAG: PhoU domain-containing protein [Firmicutes bacterium]|nr:PhoU domain-containing protein [Bacillota bacterium]